MEPKYLIAQGVGFAAAAASIAWAVAVHRVRARVPLIGGVDLRYLPAIVGWMALMVLSFVVVFGYELVPRDSPGLFAAMLGWITIGFIAGLFALIATLQRRFAVGWLTFVDDRTLRVEGNGSAETIVCSPGSVAAFLTEREYFLEFQFQHEDGTLHLVVLVGLAGLGLAREGVVVRSEGPQVGISGRRFCRWVRPYVATESARGP
jgi:hypothetical protein